MKCFLHIGTEKTATTSFQRYMRTHRDVMLGDGFWYPRSLGNQWHRDLAVYAMDFGKRDDAFEGHGIQTESDHEEFKADLTNSFKSELSSLKSVSSMLVSSEHFHSRLTSVDGIERVRDFLSPHVTEFEVLVHLRPQVDVLVSLASTVARGRQVVDANFFNSINLKGTYFNYDALLKMWEQVFSIDSITVIPFKREPNLLPFLSGKIDIDLQQYGPLGRDNTALDVELIGMLNVLKSCGVDTRPLGAVINDLPLKQKILISQNMAVNLHLPCEHSNDSVASRYPSVRLTDLEPDFDNFPREGNLDLLNGECSFPNALSNFYERVVKMHQINRKLRSGYVESN